MSFIRIVKRNHASPKLVAHITEENLARVQRRSTHNHWVRSRSSYLQRDLSRDAHLRTDGVQVLLRLHRNTKFDRVSESRLRNRPFGAELICEAGEIKIRSERKTIDEH